MTEQVINKINSILFERIIGHCYAVKNQNGFNAALYDYFKDCDYSKKTIRKMVQNYPLHYPTTIIIVDQSFECGRVYIEDFDMDDKWHSLAHILL